MPIFTNLTEAVLSVHGENCRCTIDKWDCKACIIYEKIKSDNHLVSASSFSDINCDQETALDAKNEILERKIRILAKELENDAKTLKNLAKENDNYSKELIKLQKAKEERLLEEKELETCIDSKRDDIEAKKIKLNELWNVVKMLDDDNVNLKREAEESRKREQHMKDEILRCQLALFANDPSTFDLYLSPESSNWKNKLNSDILNKTESLRKASNRKRMNKPQISSNHINKKLIEKFLRKQEKLVRVSEERQIEDKSFLSNKHDCINSSQASSQLNERKYTTAYQIQRPDFFWCNQNQSAMSDDAPISEKSKANIWKPFKKWNWKQEYLGGKRFATYINKKKVNPSLVPLKIIDDREELLEPSILKEKIVCDLEPDREQCRRL